MLGNGVLDGGNDHITDVGVAAVVAQKRGCTGCRFGAAVISDIEELSAEIMG